MSDCGFVSRSTFYEQFVTLENKHPDIVRHLMLDEAHFGLAG